VFVIDAGPLINLGAIDGLNLLLALGQNIVVPTSVWHEVVVAGSGLPGSAAVEAIVGHIEVVPRQGELPSATANLGPGESDVLAMALLLGVSAVGLDDMRARRVARQMGLLPVGTLGILVEAKRHGHTSAIRPYIVRLRSANHWFGDTMLNSVLSTVGEPLL
jgi:predicted nucleic acid-binding protein